MVCLQSQKGSSDTKILLILSQKGLKYSFLFYLFKEGETQKAGEGRAPCAPPNQVPAAALQASWAHGPPGITGQPQDSAIPSVIQVSCVISAYYILKFMKAFIKRACSRCTEARSTTVHSHQLPLVQSLSPSIQAWSLPGGAAAPHVCCVAVTVPVHQSLHPQARPTGWPQGRSLGWRPDTVVHDA